MPILHILGTFHKQDHQVLEGVRVLYDEKWNWQVIHMSGQIGEVEITAITGVSFCDALFRIPVIAVIPTPPPEKMTI